MRVLLVNPQLSGELRYGKFADVGSYLPPYGLLTIAAVLELEGHSVMILDADKRKKIESDEILKRATLFKPDIVGMEAYSIGVDSLKKTAAALKEHMPCVPIIAGGPHVIAMPGDLLTVESIDYLCTGEGEYTMRDIINALSDGRDPSSVAGLLYKTAGRVIDTGRRPLIQDLDYLPYPAYNLVEDLDDYAPTPLIYRRRPIIMLSTSRGCPYSCIFCYSIWGKQFRAHSAEYVVGLMETAVKKYKAREIMFAEDSFCLDKSRVMEICRLIKKKNLKVNWSCIANVITLDKGLLEAMKDSGCWLISLGIESGSEEVLKFIRKPVTIKKAEEIAKTADRIGIKTRGYFMLGHLIDTKESIKQTVKFACSLPLLTVNFCIMRLDPATEARAIAHKHGDVNYDLKLDTGHPGKTLSFIPRGLTSEYLTSMQRRAYRKFFLRPSQVWRLVKNMRSSEDIKKYLKLTGAALRLFLDRKTVI